MALSPTAGSTGGEGWGGSLTIPVGGSGRGWDSTQGPHSCGLPGQSTGPLGEVLMARRASPSPVPDFPGWGTSEVTGCSRRTHPGRHLPKARLAFPQSFQ